MLGGEGWSGGHRRAIPKLSHRDASHALNDHARRSQAVAIGPRTADGARADRVYLRRRPSRRQLPSRFRPGSPWLHPTVGRSKRTAAVNRPARMNAQRGAFCSRTDGVASSQVQYSWKNGTVVCPGLCLKNDEIASRAEPTPIWEFSVRERIAPFPGHTFESCQVRQESPVPGEPGLWLASNRCSQRFDCHSWPRR
jgi:hypothetical protein